MTNLQEVKTLTVKGIFEKPGLRWTLAEREEVKNWLYESRQLKYLVGFAKWNLSKGATAEDAEDAWQEFVLRRLDNVISLYDPTRQESSTFWKFLLFCFARYCWSEARSLRKRELVEQSFDADEDSGSGRVLDEVSQKEALNFQMGSPTSSSPFKNLYKNEIVDEILIELSKLAPIYQQVFFMRDIEGLSYEEIAVALDAPIGTVKGRLNRARQNLKLHLTRKGIRP